MSKWEPAFRSIRTRSFQYIQTLSDGRHPRVVWREYHDLAAALDTAALDREILDDSSCVGRSCP